MRQNVYISFVCIGHSLIYPIDFEIIQTERLENLVNVMYII